MTDFMVIPLGGHDIVLGVQWLSTLGHITWDFQKLEMVFKWGSSKVLLRGISPGSVREIKAKRVKEKRDSDIQLHMIYAYGYSVETHLQLNVIQSQEGERLGVEQINNLTEHFKDIFEEPKALPPFRKDHNHEIMLKEG